MRSRLQQRLEESHQGIDLSPLLDVVFILLIFFIVSTVFVNETGIDIDKPQAISSAELQRDVILIAITAEGDIVYNSTQIGLTGIKPTVSQILRKREQAVVIQADKLVSTELLVKVIDQAKLGGAAQVNIATEGF